MTKVMMTARVIEQRDGSVAVTLRRQRGIKAVRIARLYCQRDYWEQDLGPVLAGLGYDILISKADSGALPAGSALPEG